ncbi:ATPase, T2SS/T4P/T4SS family [Tateyamaria sp.]|uniref:ATPase, T2SS/T4P/T4SS family n=1 Tax=Tateyamaria sp. TaxID=1929288 RepID=UPI003B219003
MTDMQLPPTVLLPAALSALLDAPDVIEISANPDGAVFVDRFGVGPARWGSLSADDAERFLRWCATRTGTAITPEYPRLSGRIPGTAHRVAGLLPPVVEAPAFSIRRHLERTITLSEYVADQRARDIVAAALKARHNILVAGATGAGKTTLLNACLEEIARSAPETRLVTIEDTPEIRTRLINRVQMRASDTTGLEALLVDTLRFAPHRIVVGEIREGRVLMTLLKAWHTGHPGGMATLHANAAEEVMDRLWTLGTEVMATDPTPVLMQATDMIVFVRRGRAAPEIATILSRPALHGGGGHRRDTKMEKIYAL